MKNNPEPVLIAIETELMFQHRKAALNNWKTDKSPIEYAVIMQGEIEEAIHAYRKNFKGRDSIEHEILQTIAVGIEFLESLPKEQITKLIEISKRSHELLNI